MSANKEFATFRFPWQIPKTSFEELYESGQPITRRFWTTHKHAALEWNMEFSKNGVDPESMDLTLEYVNGPSAIVTFCCRVIGIRNNNTRVVLIEENTELSLTRGGTFVDVQTAAFNLEGGAFYYEIYLKVAAMSFDLDASSNQRPDGQQWMSDLYEQIENEESKRSDVRLISGDGHTFYCHQLVLAAQSDAMDAMFRNARTVEEKNGTFRLSAWTTEELRKILAFFYGTKPDLDSLSIDQLMNIYDFAEQHNLDRLKKFVETQLWYYAADKPKDCAEIARFADLHADRGLNPLKYRCFNVLAQNYARLGLKMREMFKETTGEPPSSIDDDKKKIDDRLMNEFTEYVCGQIHGVRILEREYRGGGIGGFDVGGGW